MSEPTSSIRFFPLPVSGTQRLLRWPLLLIIGIIFTFEVILYFIVRLIVITFEYFQKQSLSNKNKIKNKLFYNLKNSINYNEYINIAKQLDELENRNLWKEKEDCYCYDSNLVKSILYNMKSNILEKDYDNLSMILKDIFGHCIKWFETESLYNQTYYGTKKIIQEFNNTLIKSMESIKQCNNENLINKKDKIELFKHLQQSFGRTALCLSGGATMAFYQYGVVKALHDANLLPHIISGTSGGSLVGCGVAVRTDKELSEWLTPQNCSKLLRMNDEPFWSRLKRFIKTGHIYSWENWRDLTREITMGDMTFLEAYNKTGRIFNVTAVSDNHKAVLLNFRTAPDVVIWSAVIASASIPIILKPSPLMKKIKNGKLVEHTSYGNFWCDGGVACDLPIARLLEDFNVKFNIAIQCNPHIIPMYFGMRGSVQSPLTSSPSSSSIPVFRGGFINSFLERLLKLEIKKWTRLLAEMDMVPMLFGHDWRHTVNQITEGQITMYPRPGIKQYLKLVCDPSIDDMNHYINIGTNICFPYFEMIQERMKLQNALRKHINDLDDTKDHSQLKQLLLQQSNCIQSYRINNYHTNSGNGPDNNKFMRRLHSVF